MGSAALNLGGAPVAEPRIKRHNLVVPGPRILACTEL